MDSFGCTHDGICCNIDGSFMLGFNTTCTCFGNNQCYYNGPMHNTDQQFSDGCNFCIFAGNNLVKYTMLDCASTRLSCYWGGKKYENSKSVFDKSNGCVCTLNRFFFCTKRSCIKNWSSMGLNILCADHVTFLEHHWQP